MSVAVGHRLVRKICDHCKVVHIFSDSEYMSLSQTLPLQTLKDSVFFIGKGCEFCDNSGYRGRVGVNEVLVVDADIREAILTKTSATDIQAIAVQKGMTPMLQDGLRKARLGLTSVFELVRTFHD